MNTRRYSGLPGLFGELIELVRKWQTPPKEAGFGSLIRFKADDAGKSCRGQRSI